MLASLPFSLFRGLLFLLQTVALAQTNTSGDLSGTITDPSGAPIQNANVLVTNLSTDLHEAAATSKDGTFRMPLLPPGKYQLTISATGFQHVETVTTVSIGTTTQVMLSIPLPAQSTSVDVVAERPSAPTENADIQTIFEAVSIQSLPNPGSDITFFAQLAPGAVANTSQGYGNFSIFGLPATSNLFTLNGQNDNDPFLNVNKSGATNLLLGANELAEVSVTSNGYSAQYGELAGAHVNFGTRSGTNAFHGNANYYWNGRIMNANNFFSNANDVPRQFVNANQWATSLGGPIKKDKVFFFTNYEGIQVVVPTSTSPVRLPSSQFQAATLTNLAATGMNAEIPFYQQLFKAFNSASGLRRSTPVSLAPSDLQGPGCGDLTVLPAGSPCVVGYSAAPTAYAHEWQLAARMDQLLRDHDRFYLRFQTDYGVAPAFTDPLNPTFNVVSIQPQDQGQFSWSHIFSAASVNQLVGSAVYFDSPFRVAHSSSANALLPYYFGVGDGSLSSLNTADTFTPQGREVLQYQLLDDFSHVTGKHTFKTGINFHRDLINDYDFGVNTGGELFFGSIDDVFNGVLGQFGLFAQNFPAEQSQAIRTFQWSAYLEDDVRLSPNLNLILSLRADHNGIPTCPAKCFASSVAPFTVLNHDAGIPFDAAIQTGQRQAYPALDAIVWQPRIGFAYSPFASRKTVFRGGAGVFGDTFPAGVVDGFAQNMPQFNAMELQGTSGYAATPVADMLPGGVFNIARAADQAVNSAFHSGATLASLTQSDPLFTPPNLTTSDSRMRLPQYYEWNLEFQQQLPWDISGSVNYVGNRGIREIVANSGLNTFCAACSPAFTTFPSTPVDARFFNVTQYQRAGVSRYNGLIISLRETLSEKIQFNFNYAYSHSLDDVSNGGLAPFGGNAILTPVNPFNLRAYNWGNSDYDVRHYFSASYLLNDVVRSAGFRRGPNSLFGGWLLSGTIFHRTGFFYSVIDSATNLAGVSNPTVFAYSNSPGRPDCGASGVYTNGTPCLKTEDFTPVVNLSSGLMTGLGNQSRNQYRGPGYFNTDLSISKSFRVSEKVSLSLGAQFFNLFNHPNFALPVNDIESPLFGQIVGTVSGPTSIVGSLLGGDASPRMIQLHGKISF